MTASEQGLRAALSRLARVGGEWVTDWDGIGYVTVPLGYGEAVEIERSEGRYWVTARAWAPDHGLNAEVEIGNTVNWMSAVRMAQNLVAEHERSMRELERMLASQPGDCEFCGHTFQPAPAPSCPCDPRYTY